MLAMDSKVTRDYPIDQYELFLSWSPSIHPLTFYSRYDSPGQLKSTKYQRKTCFTEPQYGHRTLYSFIFAIRK